VPPFSGFFSKDEILWKVFQHGWNGQGAFYYVCWGMGMLAAFCTAFYMVRLMAMTFFGEYRGAGNDPFGLTVPSEVHHASDDHAHDAHGAHDDAHADAHTNPGLHVHVADDLTDHGHAGNGDHSHGPAEVPWNMWVPVFIFAVLAVVLGFLNLPPSLSGTEIFSKWLEPLLYQVNPVHAGHHAAESIEYILMGFAIVWALSAMALAWWMYIADPGWAKAKAFVARFPQVFEWVNAKYYVDEFYDAMIIGPIKQFSAQLWSFDNWVIDGTVNGAARFTVILANASDWFDAKVVDGLVNSVAWGLQQGSLGFKALQSGRVQNYAFVMILGFLAFAFWKFLA
jgi:NADH-quinone oxidoreductase subunit L